MFKIIIVRQNAKYSSINSKHHGLLVNIPVVINVNSCFECHLIQFILCVCLNNFHELWRMAGSHNFCISYENVSQNAVCVV